MKRALLENWALFAAMMMLMVANGLLATLLTIRGAGLGFSDLTISLMQGAYPLGALIGTIVAPRLIEKVGHIRAFSAFSATIAITRNDIKNGLDMDPPPMYVAPFPTHGSGGSVFEWEIF